MHANTSRAASTLCCLALALAISATAQTPTVGFVKIQSIKPLQVAAPEVPVRVQQLGLRLVGIPLSAIELKIYGLKGDRSDSPTGQMQEILSVPVPELKKHNLSAGPDEIVYSLSSLELDAVIELIARLTDADGSSLGKVAHFTVDKNGSLQQSPSLLARAATVAPEFLRRLSHIYDSVREEADLRNIYVVDLAAGKPASPPAKLDLPPAMLQGLTLSPAGLSIAWLTSSDSGFDLWSSPVATIAAQKVLHSEDSLITPFFVDEDLIAFVQKSSLTLVSTAKPKRRSVQVQLLSIRKLFQVTAKDGAIDFVVEAEAKDAPGLVTHYDVRISGDGKVLTVNRLPDNPYYDAYAVSRDSLPIFFAGTTDQGEGIHYLTLDNTVTLLFPCKQPGLVTVAANGSRVAFAATK